jgi:hypothetical protein
MDNIVNDAVHCPNCGASLISPSGWTAPASAPQGQYQQQPPQGPPQQQYQVLPQQYAPQPPKPQRVATVMNIGLTEILFLFSGFLLISAGFQNFSYITLRNIPGQYILLGILAILAGLFILVLVIMPRMLKGMDNIMGFLMLGLSVLFIVWGLAALFANNVGVFGGELVAAGLAGLAGVGLKMGLLK